MCVFFVEFVQLKEEKLQDGGKLRIDLVEKYFSRVTLTDGKMLCAKESCFNTEIFIPSLKRKISETIGENLSASDREIRKQRI